MYVKLEEPQQLVVFRQEERTGEREQLPALRQHLRRRATLCRVTRRLYTMWGRTLSLTARGAVGIARPRLRVAAEEALRRA